MDEQGSEHVEELDARAGRRSSASRRPRALWAVLAVVAVAAGALVVTSADDDGNQRPGLPVDLAVASGAGGAEAAAADSSMRAWVTYVPGDDLPALGGEATAYRLAGDVDEAQVRALADALGLDGEVQSDGAGSWWVAGEWRRPPRGVRRRRCVLELLRRRRRTAPPRTAASAPAAARGEQLRDLRLDGRARSTACDGRRADVHGHGRRLARRCPSHDHARSTRRSRRAGAPTLPPDCATASLARPARPDCVEPTVPDDPVAPVAT